jgi:hypothetical protein
MNYYIVNQLNIKNLLFIWVVDNEYLIFVVYSLYFEYMLN